MATALYTANDFILISLPQNAQPVTAPGSKTDSLFNETLIVGRAFVSDFKIPEFKIGSLDTLIV